MGAHASYAPGPPDVFKAPGLPDVSKYGQADALACRAEERRERRCEPLQRMEA